MNSRALLIFGLLLTPAMASAQSSSSPIEQRVYIQVGGGAQSGSHTLTNTSTFTIYGEQGTIAGGQEYGGGALWNIGGGFRAWKNLHLALNFTRNSDSMDTAVVARVPHPLFLNRPRTATQNIGGLKHEENGFHLAAMWVIPVGDDMQFAFGGGPSFVTVKHDFATDARVVEQDAAPNFATVAIQDITLTTADKTATTVNLGAELTYNLPFELGETGRLGATVGFRYAGGTVNLPGSTGDVDVKYGGAQFFGALRVSF
jgi:hypothetical protein